MSQRMSWEHQLHPSLAIPCKISSTMPWLMGWQSNIIFFQPYLGKWSNLTNIFQMGWNHQQVILSFDIQDWCFWVTYNICNYNYTFLIWDLGCRTLKKTCTSGTYHKGPLSEFFASSFCWFLNKNPKRDLFFVKSKPPRFIPTSCVPCFIFQRWYGNFLPRRVISSICFAVLAWNGWRFRWLVSQLLFGVAPLKTNMSPENQWLVQMYSLLK